MNTTTFDPTLPHPPAEEPPPNHPIHHMQPTQNVAHAFFGQPIQPQSSVPQLTSSPRNPSQSVANAIFDRPAPPQYLSSSSSSSQYNPPSNATFGQRLDQAERFVGAQHFQSDARQQLYPHTTDPAALIRQINRSPSFSSNPARIAVAQSYTPPLRRVTNYSSSTPAIRHVAPWQPQAQRQHNTCCKLIAAVVLVIFTKMALDMFFNSIR